MTGVVDILRSALRKANLKLDKVDESWEQLSRKFELKELSFRDKSRVVYITDGRLYFPLNDGRSHAQGWSSPREIQEMGRRGLIDEDSEIYVVFRKAPTLETVISTLRALPDMEEASTRALGGLQID